MIAMNTPIPPAPSPRPARVFAPGERVHILAFAVAKCRTVKGLPSEWGPGHSWIREADFRTVPLAHRCPHCLRVSLGSGAPATSSTSSTSSAFACECCLVNLEHPHDETGCPGQECPALLAARWSPVWCAIRLHQAGSSLYTRGGWVCPKCRARHAPKTRAV